MGVTGITRVMAMYDAEKLIDEAILREPQYFEDYVNNYCIACKEKLIVAAYHEILNKANK